VYNQSNKNLITFVLFALAVTLLGMWVLYGKIQATGLTASPTGTVQATIYSTADITLVSYLVNFANVSIGYTYRTNGGTSNNSGANAFLLRNDGSTTVNITFYASTALFTTQSGNSSYYRFNATNATGNTTANQVCQGDSPNQNTWYNLPVGGSGTVATKAICNMNYVLNNNYMNISIEITVPSGESSGAKTSSVMFTASQAS
jgi:hypothetical protein